MFLGHKDREDAEEPLTEKLSDIIVNRFKDVDADDPVDIYDALGFEENDKKLANIIEKFHEIDMDLIMIACINLRSFLRKK